jgi:Bor protein
MRRAILACAALLVSASGCYRITVNTGAPPAAADSIVRPWNNSFVYGLVPPAPVSTADKCTNGVAQVTTQRSFLNGLVGAITWGIYTPLEIRATCASGPVRTSAAPTDAPATRAGAR